MYFDFEDYHPDISPVGQAISWREGVLLSIIAHLVMVILILVAPKWFPWLTEPRRVQVVRAAGPQQEPPLQFMIVAPRVERPVAEAAGARAAVRSESRGGVARAREEAREHGAVLARQHARARGRAAAPDGARAGAAARSGRRAVRAENAQPDPVAEASRVAVGAAAAVDRSRASRRTAPTAARRRRADRSATRCATCSATRRARRSTTRAAAAASSARRFSSTPRASSSARGSAASSRRSSATGSSRTPRCR